LVEARRGKGNELRYTKVPRHTMPTHTANANIDPVLSRAALAVSLTTCQESLGRLQP
jgi:hypothetical protein